MTTTDDRRVAAIAAYDVLDGPPRRELMALVALAAQLAGVPKATINLITRDEQCQVATVGFAPAVCASIDSFCRTVVETERPILVEDARKDRRFADNPHTSGELDTIRFYAAHPLVTPTGVTVGTLCVYDDQPHPITGELAGGLELLAGRVVDVLELELTSRRLEEANDALGRSNEWLAAFAGQVSHDLKNPLASIRMCLEMLEEDLEPGSEPAVLAARATGGVLRMNDLINDLLGFATLGSTPGSGQVDLATEAAAALDDLADSLDSAVVVVDELPVVRGEASQLRAVLQNLVGNAAKHTPDDQAPDITLRATRGVGVWRIEVADRAPAIPPEARARIFEPLVRLDRRVTGSGLGLATCRRVIEAHGGSIGVDPGTDGGNVFWFELPVADAATRSGPRSVAV